MRGHLIYYVLNKLPGACRKVGCGLDAKMVFHLFAESWRVSVILFLCAELCCLGRVSLYIYYALKSWVAAALKHRSRWRGVGLWISGSEKVD